MITSRVLWAVFVCFALLGPASAQEIVFASVPDARRILSLRFCKALHDFIDLPG